MKIVISSGHGLHIPGAKDLIDEVIEARRVTDRVAEILQDAGVDVSVFHDDTTRPPDNTVNTINAYHNKLQRDLDVSVHFNSVAGGTRDEGIGVETLYREGNAEMRNLASRISKAISKASGLILRRNDGTWGRNDLGFLSRTNIDRAVLLEICFVNSRTDVRLYQENFEDICRGIAESLIGRGIDSHLMQSQPVKPPQPTKPYPEPQSVKPDPHSTPKSQDSPAKPYPESASVKPDPCPTSVKSDPSAKPKPHPTPKNPDPPLTPKTPPSPRKITLDILGKVQDIGGYIENGATFVRLTDFCDAVGLRASWDEKRRLPLVTKADDIIGAILDNDNASGTILDADNTSGTILDADNTSSKVLDADNITGTTLNTVEPEHLLACQEDIRLLKEIVHWEARGEDEKGQILVANVIFNRVNSPNFPDTIKEVIFANSINSQGIKTFQFTPVSRDTFGTAKPNDLTISAVNRALAGVDYSQGATFFHAISHLSPDVWHERAVWEGRLVHLFDYGGASVLWGGVKKLTPCWFIVKTCLLHLYRPKYIE